ncbi:hypothetical protein CKAN_02618800 [Cinnamomum micranthum f. kanehirae]|uniref:DUF674 domain-containing protein n=1 Tax=Cinnamomum micranthum f. kanehirae TaxID=337451 RepID=A0A3S3RA83_9MAGN|nr:hypothetical protein CKAN_02618800 [Cinnamomum micranthum f. kanehirae]
MAAKEISLKLLVHKEKNQILYAESDKDFVDVLFSFLTMPIGTIIRLVTKKAKIGSMSTLYESLEDLDVQYLRTESCKNMLLHPKSASEDHCRNLVVNIDDRDPIEYYYICNSSVPLMSDTKHSISIGVPDKRCLCGSSMSRKRRKQKLKNGAGVGKDGVFVKGKMRYMITNDLQVSPVCTRTSLELLKRFGISDLSELEERNVNLGQEEVLHLLKHLLLSNTPLTDMFLPVQDSIEGVALILKFSTLDSKDIAQFHAEKEAGSDSKKMSLNLFVSKSRNKVLYAQVGEEFPDLLFSFLALPLGSVVKCLGGCTSMGCLDNLYKSVEEIGKKGCIKSEECKALLLDPVLVPYFGSMNQLIQINELPGKLTIFNCQSCLRNAISIKDSGSSTCLHGCETTIPVEVINPKFHDAVTELGGAFMEGPAMFMVSDELIVKPLSTISGISLFNQFNIPINDLEEHVVSVGEEEALSLLKSSLTSETVLSDVFLKKPGRRSSLELLRWVQLRRVTSARDVKT